MDAALLASLTNGYKDVTSFPESNISYEAHWSKIYGAGVILYHTQDKAYLGTYRATLDGAIWGTFPQKGYNQPDPGELSARAWIDANTPVVLTPVSVVGGGSTTTNTVINAPNISTNMIIGAVVVLLVLGYIIWPRRKTVFDQRRK
jgi:hypothetical protein